MRSQTLLALGVLLGVGVVAGLALAVSCSGSELATQATADSREEKTLAVAIVVDRTTKLGTIGPGFVGFSYEKAHLRDGFFRADNAPLVAMLRLLGPSILRVGGNTVDETVWQDFDGGVTAADAAAPPPITRANVDGLAALAKAAGWRVLYAVNLKLSSATFAAEEAAYAATALGSSLYGLEIGNEPDLFPAAAAASSPGPWTYAAYETDWNVFAAAIRARVPGVPLTGPATAYHLDTWTVPFASDEAKSIMLLSQHYYRANGQDPTSTIDFLLAPDPGLTTELQGLSAAATTNGIAEGYRVAECNSYYNGGAPGISDGYGTALWAIDFLFTNAANGSRGVNFHGGGNGPGYTPIADSAGEVIEARPVFYGMLLFSHAGQGDLLKTSGAPTSINFTTYAVGNAASGTSVVLSNKDRATTVRASVDVGASIVSATAERLTGPALEATTGVTLGGAAIRSDGSFSPLPAENVVVVSGTTLSVDVPPASAVLVTCNGG